MRLDSVWYYLFLACDPAGLVKSPKTPETPKKLRKNYEKHTKPPTPGRAPKIRKKYRKNTEVGHFCIFSVFFRIFGAPPGVGGFVFFSQFLRILGFQGFLGSLPGPRDRNSWLCPTEVQAGHHPGNNEQEGGAVLAPMQPWRDTI